MRQGRSGGGLCYGYRVVPRARCRRPRSRRRGSTRPRPRSCGGSSASSPAAGRPRAIARRLNAEGVPGPGGGPGGDTTIRGQRRARHRPAEQRALYRPAGLEPAALHQGPAAPAGGWRGRIRRSEWSSSEVPELRIVDDELWAAGARRASSDLGNRRGCNKARATRFWERRRPRDLLTGLLVCGVCGGG